MFSILKIVRMEKLPPTTFEFRNKELDTVFLQQLYSNEPAYAFDMFEGFLQDIGMRMASLSAAIAESNWELTKYYVHQIKAFIGIVGLTNVQGRAQQLERCCLTGNRELIQSLFREISLGVKKGMMPVQQEFERLKEFLQRNKAR